MRVTLREVRETAERCLWRLGVPKEERVLVAAMLAGAQRRGTEALEWLDRRNAALVPLERLQAPAWERVGADSERLDACGASAVLVAPQVLRRTCGRAAADGITACAVLTRVADPELLEGVGDVAALWWGLDAQIEIPDGDLRLQVHPTGPSAPPPAGFIDVDRSLWERLHGYAQDALLNIDRRPDPDD